MNRKTYTVLPVVLMAVFLSAILFANTNPCFAGTDEKTSPRVERISSVEHTEAQIKALEDGLMITEVQKELWSSLTQVMRNNAKEMDALRKDRAENHNDMNAVERMKIHIQITEARLNQMKKFIPSFEAFYAGMTDEQKTIIDEIFHGRR